MYPRATQAVWLLAIVTNHVMCQDKSGSGGGGSGGSGGSGGGGGGGSGGSGGSGHGSGSSSSGGGSGGGGGHGSGSGSDGSGESGSAGGSHMFSMGGMNGMQLPFPFFPPFACDLECVPYQIQVVQQQISQPAPQPEKTTTQAPTTHPPTTMKPVMTTQPQKPASSYTQTTYMMYPNWCQGWCRFFYKPQPPVYYQPNCLLFSWLGMGMQSGMGMGMHGMGM